MSLFEVCAYRKHLFGVPSCHIMSQQFGLTVNNSEETLFAGNWCGLKCIYLTKFACFLRWQGSLGSLYPVALCGKGTAWRAFWYTDPLAIVWVAFLPAEQVDFQNKKSHHEQLNLVWLKAYIEYPALFNTQQNLFKSYCNDYSVL